MSRSLKVRPDRIEEIKFAVKRNGFPRQQDLAEDLKISLATLSSYLNGRPVDYCNFVDISERLGQDWQTLADLSDNGIARKESTLAIAPDLHPFIYIKRPAIEENAYEELRRSGALVRVKAPQLMGKTSLLIRLMERVRKQGDRVAYINLNLAKKDDLEDIDCFFKWFCIVTGQALGLENRIKDYWDEEFSTSKVDCTDYFEKYLLSQNDFPLILCLDEVERIFPYQGVAQEFLGLLRAWHEQAKVRPIWGKIRLVLAHSTEVYVPLNINESPFNVGLSVELPEFNEAQILELTRLHELNWTEQEVRQLMAIVGGHPYLVERALSQLKGDKNKTLEELLDSAVLDSGIYGNHLRHLWNAIAPKEELLKALKAVCFAFHPVRLDSFSSFQLDSLGVILIQKDGAIVRCNLYRQYFSDRLGERQ
ncbi:MAG: AAA-like domain-containing protein [Cyanobacteria bacterium P01_E01_bin.42]